MVTKEEIEKLINSTDMFALVSPYVKLIKSGSGYKGICPFHSEKTPSFSVSQEKHLAHCFSCGKGGNPIQFLMDIKHLNFIEAVKELAKINHMYLQIDDVKDPKSQEKEKYYALNDLANKLFTRNLLSTNEGQKAIKYLNERGLDIETIKEFSLGLAPRDGKMLYNLLKESNYLELDMVSCGLVKNNDNNYYDFFTNRIMFPIKDIRGNIIGFSGRTYKEDSNQAKYMNTYESLVFKKNLVLYNLDLAIDSITLNDRIILHEGYMDVIASYRSGLKEVVCSMGTSLTSGQINLIGKYTKNVIICYDSDNAGIKASFRAGELFLKSGFNVNLVKLDKTKDSDEYVKKYGLEAYKSYFLSHIISFIDYVYNEVTTNININDISSIENAKNNLFKYLKLYKSNLIWEKYLTNFAKFLNISLDSIKADFYKNDKIETNIVVNYPKEDKKEIKENNFKYAAIRIFDYAKSSKIKALEIDNYLEKDNRFIGLGPILGQLWQAIISFYQDNFYFDEEKFVLYLQEKNLYNDYYHMISLNEFYAKLNLPYSDSDLNECLESINKEARNIKLNNIQQSISMKIDEKLAKELTIKKFKLRQKCEQEK